MRSGDRPGGSIARRRLRVGAERGPNGSVPARDRAYYLRMESQGKIRRRPKTIAILVGTLCFLLSFGIVAGIGISSILWLKQVSPTLGIVLTWAGPLPMVMVVIGMTVWMMELFEKTTGISLRTRSSRTSR